MILEGKDVNAKDENGFTALHVAAFEGDVEMVTVLLEEEADIEAQTKEGLTALHWAAVEGKADVVKLLLEQGADAGARDEDGWTALHWAAYHGHGHSDGVAEAWGGRGGADHGRTHPPRLCQERTPRHHSLA